MFQTISVKFVLIIKNHKLLFLFLLFITANLIFYPQPILSEVKKSKQLNMSDSEKKLFGIDKLNIKRSSIPAITHVDYSARIQTVHKETNLKYYNLMNEFKKLTQCPILVNTSFNIRGEPIVCSVEDAFKCFMGTELDILVCENFILHKKEQDQNLLNNYKSKIELD